MQNLWAIVNVISNFFQNLKTSATESCENKNETSDWHSPHFVLPYRFRLHQHKNCSCICTLKFLKYDPEVSRLNDTSEAHSALVIFWKKILHARWLIFFGPSRGPITWAAWFAWQTAFSWKRNSAFRKNWLQLFLTHEILSNYSIWYSLIFFESPLL